MRIILSTRLSSELRILSFRLLQTECKLPNFFRQNLSCLWKHNFVDSVLKGDIKVTSFIKNSVISSATTWQEERRNVLLTFYEGIHSFETSWLARWCDAVKFQGKPWSVTHNRPCRLSTAKRIYLLLLPVYMHVRH